MSPSQIPDFDFAGSDEQSRAGSGAWKATPRDLYGTFDPASIPENIPELEDWCSLPWDTYPEVVPSPAGKDEKPSWGSGAKPLMGAPLARCFLHLTY
jgi:hypothetical protein